MRAKNITTPNKFLSAAGVGLIGAASGCNGLLGGGEPVTVQWTLEEVGSEGEALTDEREQQVNRESYFTDRFEISETTDSDCCTSVPDRSPDVRRSYR